MPACDAAVLANDELVDHPGLATTDAPEEAPWPRRR